MQKYNYIIQRIQNRKACLEFLRHLREQYPHLRWYGTHEEPEEFIPPVKYFPIYIYITEGHEVMFYSKIIKESS